MLKSGALIRACAEMGCILAGGSQEQRRAVISFAEKIGLAFQVRDDVLDVSGDEATLGKPVGSDARSDKSTFVSLKGLNECYRLIDRLTQEALQALDLFEDSGFLRWLACQLAGRKN